MEEKKKSKKGLIAIIIILVLLLIVAIIYFALTYFNGSKSTGTTWGDTYYAYLTEGLEQKNDEERQKYGLQSGVETAELQFIETDEEENPVMLMSYEKDDTSYTNIYYINDQNSVSSALGQEYSDAQYLYNINNKEYNWYLHSESDSTDSYTDVSNIINNENQSEPEYVFDKNNKTEVKLEDGNTVELSEFDETFIRPDIEDNNKQEISIVDYVANDIAQKINSLVSNYDKESDKINEDVQNKVDSLVQVAEEAIKENGVIKAGNYTLKFGSYVDKYGTEYILNSDGTATCTSTELPSRNLTNGKYVVYNYNDYEKEIDEWEKENGPIGFSGEWMIAIGENVDESKPYLTYSYNISNNNEFYNGQTDEIWAYQEEKNEGDEATQTASTFKVGNYTLHYGTYKGTDGQYADGRGVVKWNVTIKLNQDGTYTLTSSDQTMQKNNSGTFEVTTLQGKDVVEFNGGGLYIVDANDTLTLYAGSGKSFTYQE